MKHKKQIIPVVFALVAATIPSQKLYASSPYEGNESEWLSRCSVAQDSEEAAQECKNFKEYYAQQSASKENEVASLQSKVDELKGDMSNISEVIDGINAEIEKLDTRIAATEANIALMTANIADLDVKMAEKQEEIQKLDELVKARMVSEQASIGTNHYIDIIMGAQDIVEMMSLFDGIRLITQSDQDQMDDAAQARAQYQLQQTEQERLQEEMAASIKEMEELREVQKEGKEKQEQLYQKFYEKEAEMLKKMRDVQADVSSMQGKIASINTDIRDDIFQEPVTPNTPDTPEEPDAPDNGNDGSDNGDNGSDSGENKPVNTNWLKPISYAWYCGTWYYPGGSYEHLGADYSGPAGAAVVAPAKAIVLYADAPYSNGTTGWIGYPSGGGNTMHLLTQVNGTTYAISFFHLSPGFLVSPGDVVNQGQVLAYSGNTGNTTGPHLHVEVLNLGSMSVTQAQAQFARTADFAWGTGWSVSSACSNRGTPCRERPENFFGY